MSRFVRRGQSTPTPEKWNPPSVARSLAVAFGAVLVGSSLAVFYHVSDVAGGVAWLGLSVSAAILLAAVLASRTTVRSGVRYGLGLFALGVLVYLALVPELHDDVLTVDFLVRWLGYLSGKSVLGFRQAGLWAAAVAPGPAFLTTFLLLSRRYDGAAVVGGLMLGFFTLTGDAGPTTTLVGMISVLGLVGMGAIERFSGTVREVARLGFVLAVATLAARWFRLVPDTAEPATARAGGGPSPDVPITGDLDVADERAHIHESISFSPTVYFTIAADRAAFWHVGAYDRYTGSDWIRTGEAEPYDGALARPPGDPARLEQAVTVERPVGTLPAAWKPVDLDGVDPSDVMVTALGGLDPGSTLRPPLRYRVASEVTTDQPAALREAETEYPASIRDRYLRLPEGTADRVIELAEEVGGTAETPYDAAVAIRRWLLAEKSYSLEVDRPGGDVVETFLFELEGGYCVYFASAMAVVLRALGIPCRFVLGYTTGQRIARDQWVVRGMDSHAWVQVYFPGVGWVDFDPTPNSDRSRVQLTYLSIARRENLSGVDTNASRRAWQAGAAERFAVTGNLSGDRSPANASANASPNASAGDPAETATSGSGGLEEAWTGRPPAEAVESAGRWLGERDRVSLLASAAGTAIGLHWLGAFQRGSRALKLRRQRPTESPRRDVERAYERLELLLAGHGRDRGPGETPRQYAAVAGETGDDGRVSRVVDLYERARYGEGVTRSEADEAIRIVDELVDDR